MGITRAVIGAVAAAGVARLLAPKQTERAIEAVKEGVSAGLHGAEDTMGMKPKRARSAAARVKAGAARTMKTGATRAKRAVKSAASKTKTAAKKAAPKVRKAARRPRKAGR